ncbi:hypothetical protein D6825_01690 [Candidatus Woesearchaeota archaeon]|nr:MAG: hypothetical protein D6825_01690 [Candidatus Woesearchaeota archaeon]
MRKRIMITIVIALTALVLKTMESDFLDYYLGAAMPIARHAAFIILGLYVLSEIRELRSSQSNLI